MLTKAEWEKAQQDLVKAWHQGDVGRAFAEIDKVLSEGTAEMKGQSLLYRGMIKDSRGDSDGAQQDWLEALGHAAQGSYARYVVERCLGEAFVKLGSPGEALEWYRAALRTCTHGGAFSGGLALKAFLAVAGQLSPDDEALASTVAVKSWRILELPGSPDLKDLSTTAGALAKKASEP